MVYKQLDDEGTIIYNLGGTEFSFQVQAGILIEFPASSCT